MIRLYCLAQGMKKLNKDEVNALVRGNDYYSRLMRALPWILPRKSRYDMFQCMMLSGIERKEFKSVIEDVPPEHTLTRIKNYHTLPDAYVIEGHQTLDDEDYITVAQSFWWSILEPLQIGPWAQEDATPLLKMYWCQQIARTHAYLLIKASSVLNPEWGYAINTLQSLAKISHMDCIAEWDPNNYPGLSKGNYLRWLGQYKYNNMPNNVLHEQFTHPDFIKHVHDVYYTISEQVDEMYLFLYHCNMFGFVNSNMIEGDWLYES